MKAEIFVVTAFRWGNRSDHSYTIGATTNKDEAIKWADEHTQYRGGKYACTVESFIEGEFNNDMDIYGKDVYKTKSLRD